MCDVKGYLHRTTAEAKEKSSFNVCRFFFDLFRLFFLYILLLPLCASVIWPLPGSLSLEASAYSSWNTVLYHSLLPSPDIHTVRSSSHKWIVTDRPSSNLEHKLLFRFSERGVWAKTKNRGAILLFWPDFPENCMKVKETGPGASLMPSRYPWDTVAELLVPTDLKHCLM